MAETNGKTTEVCFRDFVERFEQGKLVIPYHVEITQITVARWIKDGFNAGGEIALKVRYFLKLVGYDVLEINILPDVIKDLGMCIFLGMVCVKTVAEEISTTENQILRYFHTTGRVEPSPARVSLLENYLDPLLGIALKQWRIKEVEVKSKLGITQTSPEEPKEINEEYSLDDFSKACSRVLSMGRVLLDGPPERRMEMRKEIGQGREPLLHLTWEVLNSLLSERPKQQK